MTDPEAAEQKVKFAPVLERYMEQTDGDFMARGTQTRGPRTGTPMAKPVLHIVYRSYGGENMKGRPEYYSKLIALLSLVRSFQQVGNCRAEIIFINDGPIPGDRLRVMEGAGEVLSRSGLGLRGSLREALSLPSVRRWQASDLVWFSEDDYLYLPQALSDLISAANTFPQASYFGLYALIGKLLPNGQQFEDPNRVPRDWIDCKAVAVRHRTWWKALSTTSTFGARVNAVAEDARMMRLAMKSGGAWDHTTCLMYQGFLPYPGSSLLETVTDSGGKSALPRRMAICGARAGMDLVQIARNVGRSRKRVLIAPNPALITHLETKYLATGTDWRAVAQSTKDWADAESGQQGSLFAAQ
jgi:hypothetical protein